MVLFEKCMRKENDMKCKYCGSEILSGNCPQCGAPNGDNYNYHKKEVITNGGNYDYYEKEVTTPFKELGRTIWFTIMFCSMLCGIILIFVGLSELDKGTDILLYGVSSFAIFLVGCILTRWRMT